MKKRQFLSIPKNFIRITNKTNLYLILVLILLIIGLFIYNFIKIKEGLEDENYRIINSYLKLIDLSNNSNDIPAPTDETTYAPGKKMSFKDANDRRTATYYLYYNYGALPAPSASTSYNIASNDDIYNKNNYSAYGYTVKYIKDTAPKNPQPDKYEFSYTNNDDSKATKPVIKYTFLKSSYDEAYSSLKSFKTPFKTAYDARKNKILA